MEKLGYRVTFNPPGDGDCFYSSAAQNAKPEDGDLRLPQEPSVRREYLNFNLTLER